MSELFKNVTVDGSEVPGGKVVVRSVRIGDHTKGVYIPELEKALPDISKGAKMLLTIMADTEGFYPGSRSFRTNNPGNIGNVDTGSNRTFQTLAEGIKAQYDHMIKVAEGKSKSYPLGKEVYLKPGFSKEMDNNRKIYGVTSGYFPGYRFVYTGQLDQYVKIYATLSRVNNVYLSRIVSWLVQNGIPATAQSKIQDIIK